MSIRTQRQLSIAILRVTTDGTQRTFRIRGCRSNAPYRVWRTDWAGPAGHHRVWKRSVSPSMTVLARRVLMGIPGRGKRVHQGATVLVHRTLAGATGKVWRVHRAQWVPTRALLPVQRSVPRAPIGHTEPSTGLSFGHYGQHGPECSFGQDGPRSRTTLGRFGVIDDMWVSGGLSPPGSGLFGSGSGRPFGTTVQ